MIPVFNPRLSGIPVSKRIEITRDLANYDEAKFGEHFKNLFTGKMASGMDGISYILALNTQAGEAIIFQLLKEYFTFGLSSNTP